MINQYNKITKYTKMINENLVIIEYEDGTTSQITKEEADKIIPIKITRTYKTDENGKEIVMIIEIFKDGTTKEIELSI